LKILGIRISHIKKEFVKKADIHITSNNIQYNKIQFNKLHCGGGQEEHHFQYCKWMQAIHCKQATDDELGIAFPEHCIELDIDVPCCKNNCISLLAEKEVSRHVTKFLLSVPSSSQRTEKLWVDLYMYNQNIALHFLCPYNATLPTNKKSDSCPPKPSAVLSWSCYSKLREIISGDP